MVKIVFHLTHIFVSYVMILVAGQYVENVIRFHLLLVMIIMLVIVVMLNILNVTTHSVKKKSVNNVKKK
jgi:hypothetical protein